jgi:hypothetical protein
MRHGDHFCAMTRQTGSTGNTKTQTFCIIIFLVGDSVLTVCVLPDTHHTPRRVQDNVGFDLLSLCPRIPFFSPLSQSAAARQSKLFTLLSTFPSGRTTTANREDTGATSPCKEQGDRNLSRAHDDEQHQQSLTIDQVVTSSSEQLQRYEHGVAVIIVRSKAFQQPHSCSDARGGLPPVDLSDSRDDVDDASPFLFPSP